MATIRGYASATSVRVGDSIRFHLSSAPAGVAPFNITRVFGSGGLEEVSVFSQQVPFQPDPAANAWEGYGWSPTRSVVADPSWKPGLYRLSANVGETICDFVVRPANPGARSKILVQVCVNTPHAYFFGGGKSFYDGPNGPKANVISLDRPELLFESERFLMEWLDTEGIVAEYCTSIDLHQDPRLLDPYDLLILAGHDEYWSAAMRDHVDRFVCNGGNVLMMSGNSCYRQIRIDDPAPRKLTFYKHAGLDANLDTAGVAVSGAQPPVCRPPNSTIGVGFTHGAGSWLNMGMKSGVSYQVRFPDHWSMAGVVGGSVATGLIGYETDAVSYLEEPEGYPRITGDDGTPETFTILGTADLRHWLSAGKAGMATMGFFVRNGTVFNTASVSWQEGLVGNSRDENVVRITRNVVNRLRTRRVWDVWEQIGDTPTTGALTALDRKLYLAGMDQKLYRRFPMGANAPWTAIDSSNGVDYLAPSAGRLWGVTGNNRVVSRPAVDTVAPWTDHGAGPAAGVIGLAGTTFLLYAVDSDGVLWVAKPESPIVWNPLPSMAGVNEQRIVALAAHEDILFAVTSNNRLFRTHSDFVFESSFWADVMHCHGGTGLASLGSMLYVVTDHEKLWWLDLRGVRKP